VTPLLCLTLVFRPSSDELLFLARGKLPWPCNLQRHLTAVFVFIAFIMALDFVAGCVGGLAQVISGHPLDTIKVTEL